MEDGDVFLFAEDEAAGAVHGADDVDHFGLRDGDHVVGENLDILLGVLGFHDGLDRDLGDLVLAAGIVGGAGQGEGARGFAPRDPNGAAGIGVESAGEGEDLEEGFAAADLVDAGGAYGAEDGDRLAAELGDENRDGGGLEDGCELFDQLGFQLLDRQAAGVDAADNGQVDIAAHIDADGLVGDLFNIDDADDQLVIGAEDVSGGRLLGAERRAGRGEEGREKSGQEEANAVHGGPRGDG